MKINSFFYKFILCVVYIALLRGNLYLYIGKVFGKPYVCFEYATWITYGQYFKYRTANLHMYLRILVSKSI